MTRDITTEASDKIAQRAAQRREKELRGAWRAGYDYLNVFDPDLSIIPLGACESLPPWVGIQDAEFVPSDRRIRHADYAYDIDAVPDDVIKRAINGEIHASEVRGSS